MLCFGAVPLQALMPCGQVSACPAPSLCPLHFLHSCAVFSLPPSSSFLLASFSFFRTFLRLSFQVLVINFYFVKGFCCTRFCIFTESDWLLFSFSKIRFLFSTLFSFPSCPVTVLVLAPSISNVQTVLADQHQVYLMFR